MRAALILLVAATALAPVALAQQGTYDDNRSVNGSLQESVPPVSGGGFLSSLGLAAVVVLVLAAALGYVFFWRGGAMHDEGLYRNGRLRP